VVGGGPALHEVQSLQPLRGMVTTSPRIRPAAEMLMVADDTGEPLLARCRCGLGQPMAFTSDAGRRWAAAWSSSPAFDRFWSEIIRGVARRNAPAGVTARIVALAPDRAKLIVEVPADGAATAPVP